MTDIIVVGGGPAGLTAGLYAVRAGKSALVLEEGAPGGQICYSPLVENYPGVPSVPGSRLAEELTAQAEGLGVRLEYESVAGFRPEDGGFAVETDWGVRRCKALVLATGVNHRPLGLPGEEALVGRGLSYCAVCDGPFFQGRPVAVVGGGDTALQEALFLAGLGGPVTLIHRRDRFRGSPQLAARAAAQKNITCWMDCVIQGFQTEGGELRGLAVRHLPTGALRELAVEGLFVAVGRQPRNQAFAPLVSTDAAGYLLAGEDCRTSLPGVFAAGDCRTKSVRQLTTAVGDGAVAGLAACAWVDGV